MPIDHFARRFLCSNISNKFKLLSSHFCTDKQPLHVSEDIWNETTTLPYEEISCPNNNHNESHELKAERKRRHLKKKFAILFSYAGKNYYGLQRNPHRITIEEELLSAMCKAEVISQQDYKHPYELYFQRASRTDKGVSALRQVVSLFLETDVDFTTVRKINKFLPSQIRVMGIKRVKKGFDAKENSDSRLYSYMLPTFAFCPVDVLCTEKYRLPRNGVDQINSVLKEYEGTHNFHNFTSHRKPEDRSCFRQIFSCKCGHPFTVDGLEFVVIRIKGQSFMLHQIRKMVGLATAIVRGIANIDTLNKCFKKEKIDFPMAPGLGLMLEKIYFDHYNWSCGDGMFEPISWDQFQDEVYNFREKHIRPVIIETEIKEKSMMKWMQESFFYTYDIRSKDEEQMYYITHLFKAFIRLKKVQNEGREKSSLLRKICAPTVNASM